MISDFQFVGKLCCCSLLSCMTLLANTNAYNFLLLLLLLVSVAGCCSLLWLVVNCCGLFLLLYFCDKTIFFDGVKL